MDDSQMAVQGQVGNLHMQWVHVCDERGRAHMEARWVIDASAPSLHSTHAA